MSTNVVTTSRSGTSISYQFFPAEEVNTDQWYWSLESHSWVQKSDPTDFEKKIREMMLINTETPELVVPAQNMNQTTAKKGDYLTYVIIELDLSGANIGSVNTDLSNAKNQWDSRNKDDEKYGVANYFRVGNKLQVSLIRVGKSGSAMNSVSVINDVSNALVGGERIMTILDNSSAIFCGLADGPYGGSNYVNNSMQPIVIDSSYYVKRFTYDVADAASANAAGDAHLSQAMATHNFIGNKPIRKHVSNCNRNVTNMADFFGVRVKTTVKGVPDREVYSAVEVYTSNDLSEMEAHILAGGDTGQEFADARYLYNLPFSSETERAEASTTLQKRYKPNMLIMPVFALLPGYGGSSSNNIIDEFANLYDGLSLDNLLVDFNNSQINAKFASDWNSTKETVLNKTAEALDSRLGFSNAATLIMGQAVSGDLLTQKHISFLKTYVNYTVNDLSAVSGASATLANLISNGYIA